MNFFLSSNGFMGAVDKCAYLAWNRRIAAFWLLKANGASTSYLTVTGRGLAAAMSETDGESVSADTAVRDLVETVKEFYRRRILAPNKSIDVLATSDPSGLPLSLSFIAFSVLTASQMRTDEKNRATAYYPRLAQLLDCPVIGRDQPQGLSPDGFAALWVHAHEWSRIAAPQPLFLPSTEHVYRRYIAYPMSHVGLRQVDLDKLPQFFESSDYAPGAAISLERLRSDFVGWAATSLTRQGQGACRDERLDIVVQQVAQELKAWDGIAHDARGRRVAHVELTLEVVRGSPRLSYLARRPPGFPEVFERGEHTFDSLEDGWYDPLPIPRTDGALLLKGFEWTSTAQAPNFVLRRGGAPAIAFVASEEYAGLTSRKRLLAGVESAVLYHESVAEQVEHRIASLASSPPTRLDYGDTLPIGWRLLTGIRIDRPSSEVVPGISALEVDAAVEIIATGGLRIGRRAAWLVDAPPRLLVSGVQSNVKIDGRSVRLGPDGAVQWDHLRKAPGVRVIEAGRTQMRLELVDAAVSDALPALARPVDCLDEHVLGLPRGRWKLIGGSPEHVAEFDLSQQRIVRCAFEPIFAIRQAIPGCVLFLADGERRPARSDASEASCRAWALAILQATDADMPLATLTPSAARHAERTWLYFVRAGRDMAGDARLGGEGGPP